MKKNNVTFILMAILIMAIFTCKADTYHSTDDGGRWHSDTTWVEGIIPGASDDVVISSGAEVVVYNDEACNNITIESAAILRGRSGGNRILDVGENVLNNGTITNGGSWYFYLHIEGDIENYGIWEARRTKMTGTGNHNLTAGATNTFSGYEFIVEATTGNLTALTDITFYDCRVDLNGKTLELINSKGSGLSVVKDLATAAYIQNAVITGNNNTIYLENEAYLNNVELTNAILEGKVVVRGDCNFYGNIIVEDTLSNPSGVNATLDVFGLITNNGIIKQAGSWNLIVYCFDDVINNGTWENKYLYFGGSTAQTISCLNNHYFSCNNVKDTSFTSNSPLIAATKLSFISSTIDLNWGEVDCNNNEIYLSGDARMNKAKLNNAVIGGKFVAGDDLEMNGLTTIKDTLTTPASTNFNLYFNGDLVNNGLIIKGGYNIYLHISGDIENNGEWKTSRTNFTGTETQNVSLQAGKEFECGEFNDMDITAPVEASTDLFFVNTDLDMNGSEMIFPVTKGLTLSLSGGGIKDGTYTMNNGSIYMENDAQVNTDAIISDVTITGKMILYGSNIVFEGDIINQDTLQSRNSYSLNFNIDGNFTNNRLFMEPSTSGWTSVANITGNIINNGEWLRIRTHLSGTGPHEISQAPGKEFFGQYFYADAGTGITTALTNLNFRDCIIDFNNEELELQGNISVSEESMSEINLQGNNYQLFMNENARLYSATVSDIELAGKVRLGFTNTFEGEIIVQDTLENYTSTSANLIVDGNITNNGIIRNYHSSWHWTIHSNGNIINNGVWANHSIQMDSPSDQHIACLNDQYIASEIFTDNDMTSKIIVDGDLNFLKTTVDLNAAELVMPAGGKLSVLSISGNSSNISDGIISGENFTYTGNPYTYLQGITIEPYVSMEGTVKVHSNVFFNDGFSVMDTLMNHNTVSSTLNVDGRIANNGFIQNYSSSYKLTINIGEHVINNGEWTNYRTILNGTSDQLIYLIAGKEITGQFRFEAMINDPPYQWKWNGSDLTPGDFTGVNSDLLIWNVPVSTNYYGYFGCQGAVDTTRNILIRTGIIIDPAVQLQGPYNGSDMDTKLAEQNLIPLEQPFNVAPWNYNGTETVTSIPTNIVDWVLVELRETSGGPETATAATMVMQRALMLRNDGRVVDPWNQTPELKYDIDLNDDIYMIVWQRNHLGVMTAVPISDGAAPALYDFSESVDKAYGGADSQADLGNGVYGMMGGDADYNQVITMQDRLGFWDPFAGLPCGYEAKDFTLDGQIDNQDKNQTWSKNLGAETQVPE